MKNVTVPHGIAALAKASNLELVGQFAAQTHTKDAAIVQSKWFQAVLSRPAEFVLALAELTRYDASALCKFTKGGADVTDFYKTVLSAMEVTPRVPLVERGFLHWGLAMEYENNGQHAEALDSWLTGKALAFRSCNPCQKAMYSRSIAKVATKAGKHDVAARYARHSERFERIRQARLRTGA